MLEMLVLASCDTGWVGDDSAVGDGVVSFEVGGG